MSEIPKNDSNSSNGKIDSARKVKLNLFVLFAILFFTQSFLYAQNLEDNKVVRSFLDDMFQSIDKTKVPTGLLRDYAFELVELDEFDGTSIFAENMVDRQTYEMMMRTINSSAVQNKPFPNVNDILTRQYKQGNENIASISALVFKYSYIKGNALTSNLIRYENGKVYDNYKNGVWQNPYATKYVTGICLQREVFSGNSLTFKLEQQCWLSNLPYKSIEVDAGNGYTLLKLGGTMQVHYSSSGQKEVKMRVTLDDGKELYSHTVFQFNYDPNFSARAGSYRTTIRGNAYKGVQTEVEIFVSSRSGSIKKPLIVVEGFDPRVNDFTDAKGSLNGVKFIDNLKDNEGILGNYNLTQQYDIIYVDWVNSEQYIQANAQTLIKVIEWVNSQKNFSGSKADNVIWAESMGGLVARYALATMEQQRIAHETSLYISYDAPHLGANIPLGALYGLYGIISFLENQGTINFIADMAVESGTYVEMAGKIAHSNAARQMLVNYVDLAGGIDNREHAMWQKELAELGFPKGDKNSSFRMISIANGSYANPTTPESYFSADLSASSDISWLLSGISGPVVGYLLNDIWAGILEVFPGKSTIKGMIQMNPGRSIGGKITDIELKYTKKFLWIADATKTIFSYKKNMPHGSLLYDIFPSSAYYPGNIIKEDNSDLDISGGGGIPAIYDYGYGIKMASHIPFVPTSSALCVGGGQKSLTQAMFLSRPEINDTPFGSNIFIDNTGTAHVKLTTDILSWINAQIDIGIIGPNHAITGTQYTIANAQTTSVVWSTTNSSIATIDQSGKLTAKSKGIVTITAKLNNSISLSKEIMVGSPNFVLEDAKREPGLYRIKAKCIDTQSSYADFITNNTGIITYKWGVKNGNQPITWIESDMPELLLNTLSESENITVYLKIADRYGNESNPVFQRIAGYDIYALQFTTLIFNSKGDMYDSKGRKLYQKYTTMPLTLRNSAFSNAKWNPTSAVVVDNNSVLKSIPWERNGYIRDIISAEDLDNITSLPDNSIVVYWLMLLNFDKKVIQKTPITIMYKANFPN